MENEEVLLLFTCDQWHSRDSQRLLGAFTNTSYLKHWINNNFSDHPITEYDWQELVQNFQTQGLFPNYIILTEKLNPKR